MTRLDELSREQRSFDVWSRSTPSTFKPRTVVCEEVPVFDTDTGLRGLGRCARTGRRLRLGVELDCKCTGKFVHHWEGIDPRRAQGRRIDSGVLRVALPDLTFLLGVHRRAASTAERLRELQPIPQGDRGAVLARRVHVRHDDLHVVLRSNHRTPVLKRDG